MCMVRIQMNVLVECCAGDCSQWQPFCWLQCALGSGVLSGFQHWCDRDVIHEWRVLVDYGVAGPVYTLLS